MLEVLVGLYGEGGGAGDGEGRRQPGSVGMGLSGCDEGLDGLEGRQGGRGGGGGPVPLGDQGEELVMVWYGMVWYGMVWYGMVWYGMVWYGMVWYGVVWFGMVFLISHFGSQDCKR